MKQDLKDLIFIHENNLIKEDSIFVLDSGRLVFCNDYQMQQCPKNPVRVSATSGNIEINWGVFSKKDKKFQLWMLAYGYFRYNSESDYLADTKASSVYFKRYGLRGLIVGWIDMIKHAPSDLNRKRLENLQSKIKAWQK